MLLKCLIFAHMPRYQVAITIGAQVYDDLEGVELESRKTACHEAQQVAWELWQDPPLGSKGPVIVRVLDSAGRLIHTVAFPDPNQTRH